MDDKLILIGSIMLLATTMAVVATVHQWKIPIPVEVTWNWIDPISLLTG